jgi:integrase
VRLPEVVTVPLVPLDAGDMWAMEDAAPEWFRAVVTLGAGLGLRRNETLGLTADRVLFLRCEVRIDRQLLREAGPAQLGPLKTKASYRTLAASDVVLDALTRHIKSFPTRPDELLFRSPRKGGPMGDRLFDLTWHATRKAAGVWPDVTSHDLRHYFASVLITNGARSRWSRRRWATAPRWRR